MDNDRRNELVREAFTKIFAYFAIAVIFGFAVSSFVMSLG